MDWIVSKFKIYGVKAQLARCRFRQASLAGKFGAANLTAERKAALARRWDDAFRETCALQVRLGVIRNFGNPR